LNAYQYAKLIENHLMSCVFIDDKPHWPARIEIPDNNPNALLLIDRIQFLEGVCLKVAEQAFFEDDELIQRSFSYDFRHEATGKLIWRIDNHCRLQPVSSRCHVHDNPDDESHRNEFFSDSRSTTFLYAMQCVNNFFSKKRQQWEEVDDVESL
jgi:hypothetical protein